MKNPLDDYSTTRILRRCGQLGIPFEVVLQSQYFGTPQRRKPESMIAYKNGLNKTIGWGKTKKPLQDKDIVPFTKEELLQFLGEGNKDIENLQNFINQGENKKLEFKSTLRWDIYRNEIHEDIKTAALKTIVAFLNSEGGTLLVGIRDDGTITGLESDKFKNDDKCLLFLSDMIKTRIGVEYSIHINSKIIPIDNKKVLQIDCKPSNNEVFLTTNGVEEFYIRIGPSSEKLQGRQLLEYRDKRFK